VCLVFGHPTGCGVDLTLLHQNGAMPCNMPHLLVFCSVAYGVHAAFHRACARARSNGHANAVAVAVVQRLCHRLWHDRCSYPQKSDTHQKSEALILLENMTLLSCFCLA
jgi:hypothetical protein